MVLVMVLAEHVGQRGIVLSVAACFVFDRLARGWKQERRAASTNQNASHSCNSPYAIEEVRLPYLAREHRPSLVMEARLKRVYSHVIRGQHSKAFCLK